MTQETKESSACFKKMMKVTVTTSQISKTLVQMKTTARWHRHPGPMKEGDRGEGTMKVRKAQCVGTTVHSAEDDVAIPFVS